MTFQSNAESWTKDVIKLLTLRAVERRSLPTVESAVNIGSALAFYWFAAHDLIEPRVIGFEKKIFKPAT